jgi:hypothetical protein
MIMKSDESEKEEKRERERNLVHNKSFCLRYDCNMRVTYKRMFSTSSQSMTFNTMITSLEERERERGGSSGVSIFIQFPVDLAIEKRECATTGRALKFPAHRRCNPPKKEYPPLSL